MSLGKVSQVNFKGYDVHLDKTGKPVHTFYYPHSDNYDLQLEILKTEANSKNGDNDELQPYNYSIDKGSISLPDSYFKTDENIYYRYKLIDKSRSGKDPIYAFDNGVLEYFDESIYGINKSPFNIIPKDRKIVSKPGRMQLQMPDMYYPGVEYTDNGYIINNAIRAKAISTIKTHANKLGGTLDGMTYMLPKKAQEGYTGIVGTPITDDEITSHLYWTQNAYKMSSSIGNSQSLKRFLKELFRNDINFVSDAALVNEGLSGIHITNLMRWGKESPFFNWFKTYNLDSNILTIGVIPENSPYLKMRIINSPLKTDANPVNSEKYDPNLPTYVQIYDSRLVSDEQEKENKIFTKYDKNIDNHYEITNYQDAIIPYYFEVNPNELKKNIVKFSAYQKGDFSDKETIKNLLIFSKFKIGERQEGGIELWDGNVDIAKLNFTFSNYDHETTNKMGSKESERQIKDFKQGIREVQDYAVLSGNYWTKLAADTQLEYAASAFKNVKNSEDALKAIQTNTGSILPKSVLNKDIANDKDLIENVLDNKYKLFKLNNISTYTEINEKDMKSKKTINTYNDILTKSIMNLPLEGLEVGNDTAALFSSGYLTKRAGTDEQIGLTRFDIYKSDYPNLPKKYEQLYKRTDKLLTNGVYKFADKVLKGYFNLEDSESLNNENGDLSDFAKYAINAVVPDLTKYVLLKALDKDAEITVEKDGSLNFDKIDKTKMGINALHLYGNSPEEEVKNLISKLEEGVEALNSDQTSINNMIRALSVRLKGLNENSFKLADMIIDRTESGLGVRIDASKDIAAIDSAREDKDNISKAWNDTLKFWSKYLKYGIYSENPHAYSTAEVTDIDKFVVDYEVDGLKSPSAADREMLKKTGVTSIANYSYLFAMPTNIYSYNSETGIDEGYGLVNAIKAKLDCLDTPEWRDNKGMLFQGPADSSIHSYTFLGNHDKPRILHVLGLDMKLYNSDFSDADSQKIALDVLGLNEQSDFDIEELSAPAIAMGKRLKDVFSSMKMKILTDKEENDSDNKEDRVLTIGQLEKISLSIARLASGIYKIGDKETYFNADFFGQIPFDVAITDVLKTADIGLSEEDLNKVADIAFKKVMMPAMEKYKAMYKMLILLPGNPTDFAGDKEAMSGFETKSKNATQQNRNAIRWEWLDKNSPQYKPFVREFKDSMDSIMSLRTKPELSALNNGHTISLVNYSNGRELDRKDLRNYSAIFRYNREGSQVIAIFGKPDLDKEHNPSKPLGPGKVSISYLNLGTARSREGLAGGLEENATFVNANPEDKSEYKIEKMTVEVPRLLENEYCPDNEIDYKNYYSNNSYTLENKETFVLKRYVDGQPQNIEISKNDNNALVLYKKQ